MNDVEAVMGTAVMGTAPVSLPDSCPEHYTCKLRTTWPQSLFQTDVPSTTHASFDPVMMDTV